LTDAVEKVSASGGFDRLLGVAILVLRGAQIA
jgi:hypothetical protein